MFNLGFLDPKSQFLTHPHDWSEDLIYSFRFSLENVVEALGDSIVSTSPKQAQISKFRKIICNNTSLTSQISSRVKL